MGDHHVVVRETVDDHHGPVRLGGVDQSGVVDHRVAAVDVGLLAGVAEVALLVVGVVEPQVGDGGADHGGVEDVRPAQRREGGQVTAEAPPPHGDPVQVQREVGRQGLQGVHLVLEHDGGDVVLDGLLPGGGAPGSAPPVGDDDREPLVGEPLGGEVGVVRGHDALAVRATVGVEEHGEGGVTVVVRWHKHGARDASCAPLGERHARGQTGVFRIRPDGRRRLPVPQHPDPGPRPVEGGGDEHGHAPRAHRRVHAGLLRQALHAEFVHPVHVHLADLRLGRLLARRGGDQHVVGADVQYRPQMQLGSGQRAFTDRQDPRAPLVGDPHELSRGAPAGHTGEEFKPSWIFVGVDHAGRPGLGVHRQVELAALVARLYEEQRRTCR